MRQTAVEIGNECGWPADWLNDAVKGFLSSKDHDSEARRLFRTYPSEQQPGLRVFVASPEDGVSHTDRADILSFEGTWAHTREMWPRGRLPDALARFGLVPWSLVPKRYVPTWARGRTSAASRSVASCAA